MKISTLCVSLVLGFFALLGPGCVMPEDDAQPATRRASATLLTLVDESNQLTPEQLAERRRNIVSYLIAEGYIYSGDDLVQSAAFADQIIRATVALDGSFELNIYRPERASHREVAFDSGGYPVYPYYPGDLGYYGDGVGPYYIPVVPYYDSRRDRGRPPQHRDRDSGHSHQPTGPGHPPGWDQDHPRPNPDRSDDGHDGHRGQPSDRQPHGNPDQHRDRNRDTDREHQPDNNQPGQPNQNQPYPRRHEGNGRNDQTPHNPVQPPVVPPVPNTPRQVPPSPPSGQTHRRPGDRNLGPDHQSRRSPTDQQGRPAPNPVPSVQTGPTQVQNPPPAPQDQPINRRTGPDRQPWSPHPTQSPTAGPGPATPQPQKQAAPDYRKFRPELQNPPQPVNPGRPAPSVAPVPNQSRSRPENSSPPNRSTPAPRPAPEPPRQNSNNTPAPAPVQTDTQNKSDPPPRPDADRRR